MTGNEPAFPLMSHTDCHGFRYEKQQGMTLRQYYAGLAMQGILSNAKVLSDKGAFNRENISVSVQIADALITELSKESKA